MSLSGKCEIPLHVTGRPPSGRCACCVHAQVPVQAPVRVCGRQHIRANATDPTGIRLIFEGFQAALGSGVHVYFYLLSWGPHAEF